MKVITKKHSIWWEHLLSYKISLREFIFIGLLCFAATPWCNPPLALLLGILIAQVVGHPYIHLNHRATTLLLQFSVVGLGFGMQIKSAVEAGKQGFLLTVGSICITILLGLLLGKVFHVSKKTSHLIAMGTAICGGSAIAAVSPAIKAKEHQISVALGVIFILNSLALLLFPYIGSLLELTQTQFGIWCAIAIHDTSSVVGAAAKYGPKALETATTVKLARALWIVPAALLSAYRFRTGKGKLKIPYFIGLFILAMVIHSIFPQLKPIDGIIVAVAKIGLTVTLFLIGCGLSSAVIRAVGIRPLVQGSILWITISGLSLYMVYHFVV